MYERCMVALSKSIKYRLTSSKRLIWVLYITLPLCVDIIAGRYLGCCRVDSSCCAVVVFYFFGVYKDGYFIIYYGAHMGINYIPPPRVIFVELILCVHRYDL